MFRSPAWLAVGAVALLTVKGLFAWAAARRSRISTALGDSAVLAKVCEDAGAERRPREILRGAALALLFVGLAGPQWGVELVETRASTRQIVVAMDVSLSMRTTDVKPSRLERAKATLGVLIDQLAGDRVGVVAFAGQAQIVCPLTTDREAAKQLLGGLDVGAIPVPGTAIGAAMRKATSMLARYPGSKTLVLLSDGEDHKSDPIGAAKDAATSGVRVFTVGIGTPEGEPIPLEGGGYKKDAGGSTVISRLGESTLSQIAQMTGGRYYRSTPGEDEIADIVARVGAGTAAKGLGGTTTRWRDHYAWPLAAAYLLLLAETLLPLLTARRLGVGAAALGIVLLVRVPATASGIEGRLRQGNEAFSSGRFDDALEQYAAAAVGKPADPRPLFNVGDALYRLDRDSDAAGAFSAAADSSAKNAPLRASSWYNLGNARYRAGDYLGAADAYRKSLATEPSDADARRNLALSIRARHDPPKKKDSKNQNQNPPPKDQQKNPDKNGEGGNTPPNSGRTRPQNSMSKDDAEQVMRAVAEREKAAQKQAKSAAQGRRGAVPPPPTGEDW